MEKRKPGGGALGPPPPPPLSRPSSWGARTREPPTPQQRRHLTSRGDSPHQPRLCSLRAGHRTRVLAHAGRAISLSDQPLLHLDPPNQEPPVSSSRPLSGTRRVSEREAGGGGARAKPQPHLPPKLSSQAPAGFLGTGRWVAGARHGPAPQGREEEERKREEGRGKGGRSGSSPLRPPALTQPTFISGGQWGHRAPLSPSRTPPGVGP